MMNASRGQFGHGGGGGGGGSALRLGGGGCGPPAVRVSCTCGSVVAAAAADVVSSGWVARASLAACGSVVLPMPQQRQL